GPSAGKEPEISPARHPILKGFEDTDIIAFGGLVPEVRPEDGVLVPATFIPTFPAYPPETSWMREPHTSIPAVVLSQTERSRIAYLPSDLDRRLNRDNLPDHARFLGNLLEWVAQGSVPLKVEGKGLIDCNLYRQERKLILHLVNLNNGTWRSPVHELIPIGPLKIEVKIPEGVDGGEVRCLVSGAAQQAARSEGWLRFQIDSLRDHEVIVFG
ncbi:MAG TPA: Tat pathway signal protein, partial [Acidobacteriota bacterium]|nr:Tat pathway signal protein [Acidobacteriota bacterium]